MRGSSPTILGIETSCDETAAAVIAGPSAILSSVVASQHDVHRPYGGVVPELAARRHIERIDSIVERALNQASLSLKHIEGIAVTTGPGLAGALLVGVTFAKALAYALRVPLIDVNHLEGHIASAWLDAPDFPTPCVVLIASGGHTHLYLIERPGSYRLLGKTLDDAAGEAFDKAAKMLGLEYPGGPAIERLARSGTAGRVMFPRPRLKHASLDFSFSGLKTALLYYLRDIGAQPEACPIADIAAEYQEAIAEVLTAKAFQAVRRCHVGALAVVGGVSANARLRTRLTQRAETEGVRLAIPPLRYCTDNAAMIAAAGQRAFLRSRFASWELEASATLSPTVAKKPGSSSSPLAAASRS